MIKGFLNTRYTYDNKDYEIDIMSEEFTKKSDNYIFKNDHVTIRVIVSDEPYIEPDIEAFPNKPGITNISVDNHLSY